MYVAVIVVAAMLLGIGFVLQQQAAEKVPAASFMRLALLTQLLRMPRWLAGVAAMAVGQLLSAWALGHLSLAVSEPLLSTSLIFALLLAGPVSGQLLRRSEILGAVLLICAVAALSATRSLHAPTESFGSFGHWPAAAVIGGIALVLAHLGRRQRGARATLTGVASGLVLGIADALTRQSVQIIDSRGLTGLLTSWQGYAVVAAATVGIWLMQSAFNAGPLHASLPAVTAAEPVAGMLLGVIVFGDVIHVTPWLLALYAASIATMICGVVLVARAPVFRGLRLLHAHQQAAGQGGQQAEPTAQAQPAATALLPPAFPAAERPATETSLPSG
jgi:drug/metabolite transporter (DMT)-like permease